MKFKLFSCALVFLSSLALSTAALSATWRVNPTPGAGAHFTQLGDVFDDNRVVDGDTIYLEGSSLSYGDADINKRVIIVGPGYFLYENPNTQVEPTPAEVEEVTFSLGSSGSTIAGGVTFKSIDVKTNNIIIKHCRVRNNIICHSGSDNTIITQNYIGGGRISVGSSQNIVVANNIIINGMISSPRDDSSITIINNIIKSSWPYMDALYVSNAIVRNNIVVQGKLGYSFQSIFYNNIGNADQFDNDNGNQQNVNMNTVFTFSGSSDSTYQLKTGSPAIGAGLDGEDCGAFGGSSPYVLSGIPSFYPSIYYFKSPLMGITGSDLPVTIKTKAN